MSKERINNLQTGPRINAAVKEKKKTEKKAFSPMNPAPLAVYAMESAQTVFKAPVTLLAVCAVVSAEIVFKGPVTPLAVYAVESAQTVFKAPVTLALTPWLCSSYYPAKETAGRMQPDQEINNNKNDSKTITS